MGSSALAASALALGFPRSSKAADSRIEILINERNAEINPNIYGHFVEHPGAVVYDGIRVGENSKIANYNGIRKSLVDALRRINAPLFRYPGGCFRDALVAALSLDIFNRHADKVMMANIAQLVNCLHSLFLADGDKFLLTPTFHVFEMFAPHMGAKNVRAVFSAPNLSYDWNGKMANFWGLSGSASVKGKQLTLTVTNPHLSEKREAEIVVRGGRIARAQVKVLSSSDVHAHNTFENPLAVKPRGESAAFKSDALTFNFASASVTRIQLNLL